MFKQLEMERLVGIALQTMSLDALTAFIDVVVTIPKTTLLLIESPEYHLTEVQKAVLAQRYQLMPTLIQAQAEIQPQALNIFKAEVVHETLEVCRQAFEGEASWVYISEEGVQWVGGNFGLLLKQLSHEKAVFDQFFLHNNIAALLLDYDQTIARFTPSAGELLAIEQGCIGQHFSQLNSPLLAGEWLADVQSAKNDSAINIAEISLPNKRTYSREARMIKGPGQLPLGFVLLFQDVTATKVLMERAEYRERQQFVVAKLGMLALSGLEPTSLMDQALRQIADVFKCHYCAVLKYQPKQKKFLTVAGFGWPAGIINEVTVPSDPSSQAGYTLYAEAPVIVGRLKDEKRFTANDILLELGVVSSITCLINHTDPPYGVLSIHSTEYREFTQEDANFLVAIANMLSSVLHASEAKRQLDYSEELFRSMANSIPQLAWMADPGGYLYWYNQRWYEYTGTSYEEMKGDGWKKVHRPDLVENVSAKLKHCFDKGIEWEDTFPIRNQNGEYRWFLSRAQPLRDKNGTILHWFGTNTDITEQLNYEQALEESESKLRIAMQTNRIGAFEYFIDSGEIIWDQMLHDIWGSSEISDLTLNHFYEGLHPDDREPVARALEASMIARSNGHYLSTYRVINRLTGQQFWIEASGQTFFANDKPFKMIGVVIDITERKEAEQTQELLSAIVKSTDDAIISKTLESRITSWNRGAERLFGYTAEEAIGQSIGIIIPPDRLNEEEQILQRLKSGDIIEHFETQRITKTGQLLDISATISPLKDSSGHIIGASKVARDVTGSKALSDSLKKAIAELQEADRRKNEFLAILGHELRNPLAALSGSVSLLERGLSQPEKVLGIMQKSIGNMAKLLDDLLDLSRVTQNRISLSKHNLNISDLIQACLEGIGDRCEKKKQIVTSSIDPGLVVEGDATRLDQIFTNLLVNASKYTPFGGRIKIDAYQEGQEIIVTIEDTGIGIEAQTLPRVFDSFYQVTPEGDAASGLGIGLALAKNLVELHGGSIYANSKGKNQGSVFEVRLPAAIDTSLNDLSVTAEKAIIPVGLDIVFVDDNPDILAAYSDLLGQLGCAVHTAICGLEAVQLIEKIQPQAALVDIGLPDINGYEVAKRLRQTGYKNKLIAISGYSHDEAREATIKAGFDHHLAKPAKMEELAAILARL